MPGTKIADKLHETIDPGVRLRVAMVYKTREKISNQQAVMMTIDTVTAYYSIRVIGIIGQVLQASIMKFVCGNAGA